MNKNRLVNSYNNLTNNNIPFNNNPLLYNNPNFINSYKDPTFYNKINMAKIEQIKRAKNINEIGMKKEELVDLVICPINVEKTTKSEFDEELKKKEPEYATKNNQIMEAWWQGRTNMPYKNIIKKDLFDKDYKKYYKDSIFEVYSKDFTNKEKLLIHKITNSDRDTDILEAELELLNLIIEKHNKELKSVYSISNETKFKKEFKYAQKFKYRLEYKPKDSEELKDYYKKEHKRLIKERKMIDNLIDLIVEKDDLTQDDINNLNKELESLQTTTHKSQKINNLKNELGDQYDEIMNNIELDEDDFKNSNVVNKNDTKIEKNIEEEKKEKQRRNRIMISSEKLNNNTHNNTLSKQSNISNQSNQSNQKQRASKIVITCTTSDINDVNNTNDINDINDSIDTKLKDRYRK